MAQAKPVIFRQFEGINNVADTHRLKASELRGATNVYVDDSRAVVRREGYGAPLASTAGAHSLFAADDVMLYRMGTSLYRLFPDRTSLEIATGFAAGAKMAYAPAPGRIFMSDGFTQRWTDGEVVRTWGIRPPTVQPSGAVAGQGKTPKGKYLFAVTYLRADGEESGTPASGSVELTGVSGINFTGIPVSAQADVSLKAIYLTKPNGKKLYRALVIPNATTTADYFGTTHDLSVELVTQFRREPPPGRVLAFFNGRMLVGDGRFLWYNPDPYKLELFSAVKVRPQPSNVNSLAVMEDGVFVGLDTRIDFHAGADFEDASVSDKAKYGACFGGVAYLEGNRAGNGLPGRAAIMVTKRGLAVCGNQGVFQNVTDSRYRYAVPNSVASVAREVNGFSQLVAVMR
jgi:hypothetical protein